jgi:hypothetical protein
MKKDFFEKIIDKLLRISETDRKADMQAPRKVAVFGIAMVLSGIFLAVIAILSLTWSMLFFAFFSFVSAAVAFLSYKFCRIFVLSDTEFQYTTFLGKKKIYKFEHIRWVKSNYDSRVIVLVDGKIHIESNAILSERLKVLFNKELERSYREAAERKARMKALKSSRSVRLAELSKLSKAAEAAEPKA